MVSIVEFHHVMVIYLLYWIDILIIYTKAVKRVKEYHKVCLKLF